MNRATNSLSNDKHEMCRLLVYQLTSVYHSRPQQIITDPVLLFDHEPNTGINKSLFLIVIMLNEDVIIEAIHELSPHSAAGLDCVPSSLPVNCAANLAPVLLIFAHSLSHGVITKSGKRAAIIPIYKSGDKTVPSNYCPISLTSIICKNFERILRIHRGHTKVHNYPQYNRNQTNNIKTWL